MGIVKALRFSVQARWFVGRLLRLEAAGKPPVSVATPPEFKDGIDGIWSPEELLVGAVASCYELTLVAIAERRRVPLHGLDVEATGHLERVPQGRYGFTVLELNAALTTEPGLEADATEIAHLAKEHCIIERALDMPVHLRLEVRAKALDPVPA